MRIATNPIRDAQIAHGLQQELNLILGSADDWRLGQLTIVRVEATPGGAHYTAFYGPFGGSDPAQDQSEAIAEAGELLGRAKGYLRSELASSLNLRRMPDLTFVPDVHTWGGVIMKAPE